MVGSSTLSYAKSTITGLIPLSRTLQTEFSYWFKTNKQKNLRYSCSEEDFVLYPAGICKTTPSEEKSCYTALEDGPDGTADVQR